MKKKLLLTGVSLLIGMSLMLPSKASYAAAAERHVQVALPSFEVKLNGNLVDNAYREFPLLVYKDITYFPMTWYDSRLLGLESLWSQQEGLRIAKSNVTSSYQAYQTDHRNANRFEATIPSLTLSLNGSTLDNADQPYPFLSYRDILYFPLTWKFAHDAFGWDYKWSDSEGLAIDSDNPQVRSVSLPAKAGDNDVAVYKGYLYFVETVDTMNNVYRAPVGRETEKKLVYSYSIESTYGLQKFLRFEIRNGELWIVYHNGGATMGSDYYVKVNDKDGTAELVHQGYLAFETSPAGTLKVGLGVPPSGNNLTWIPAGGDGKGTSVGDPNLIYGWSITGSGGYSGNGSAAIAGDDAYVLASPYPVVNDKRNRIYKINLKTNATTKISDEEVAWFALKNNKLYFVKEADHLLYAANPDGSNVQRISDNKVTGWFDEIGGTVYYTSANENGELHLYKADTSKEDVRVFAEMVESVQTAGGKLICKLAKNEPAGIKVLDSAGNLLLTVTDQAYDLFTDDGNLAIVSASDHHVSLIDLGSK